MQSNNFSVGGDTSTKQEVSSSYDYYLSDVITHDHNTLSLIKQLKTAHPNDIVHIHINTPGGDMYTTMQIINSIRACPATVATHADGQVASAGSLIFFSGDMMSVAELSTFLIHNGSGGIGGKMSDMHLQSDDLKATCYKIFHSVYEPFLTSDEVDKVLSGVDIYLDSEQVIGRINKVCDVVQEDNNNKNENNDEQTKRPAKTKRVGKKK